MRKLLYCAREMREEEEVLARAFCESLPRPAEQEACNLQPCPPRWKVMKAGPCSSPCGLGIATQAISCVQLSGGLEVELAGNRCLETEKPPTKVPCIVQKCLYEWQFTPWTECSLSCGTGIQRRQDFCINPQTGARVNPIFCMRSPKALTVRTCSVRACLERAAADAVLEQALRAQPPEQPTTAPVALGPGGLGNGTSGLLPLSRLVPSARRSEEMPGDDDAEEKSHAGLSLVLGSKWM
ncbi:A disintegrin and metalloproteinase with thrombospondin motifs 13-like [Varanus komodoensis]|uniref:A disintegrin and metalloproteinase with thrombospondin motifs 13-like n=1 Tax=Varanus komodoensis TaxID=61221 RepID=UPI001CF77101|nr:A disintegrin and metalloproteinase with thrombospondin motifs 13-like [Varanus komodoensis]